MNGARKKECCDDRYAIQGNIAAMTLFNLERDDAVAMAPGRWRHGFTRTTEIATAKFNIFGFNSPISFCDFTLPGCAVVGVLYFLG